MYSVRLHARDLQATIDLDMPSTFARSGCSKAEDLAWLPLLHPQHLDPYVLDKLAFQVGLQARASQRFKKKKRPPKEVTNDETQKVLVDDDIDSS